MSEGHWAHVRVVSSWSDVGTQGRAYKGGHTREGIVRCLSQSSSLDNTQPDSRIRVRVRGGVGIGVGVRVRQM